MKVRFLRLFVSEIVFLNQAWSGRHSVNVWFLIRTRYGSAQENKTDPSEQGMILRSRPDVCLPRILLEQPQSSSCATSQTQRTPWESLTKQIPSHILSLFPYSSLRHMQKGFFFSSPLWLIPKNAKPWKCMLPGRSLFGHLECSGGFNLYNESPFPI